MTRMDINEANDHFLELMKRVASGEEVIIEQDDQPVARISPLSSTSATQQPRTFGSAKGLIHIADDFDEPLEDFYFCGTSSSAEG